MSSVDVIILKDIEDVAMQGARMLRHQLRKKSDSVLGLATGSTPLALYEQLIQECANGRLSFRCASTFNLDEYLGLQPGDAQSYRSYMQRYLFDKVDIDIANTYLPGCGDGEDPKDVGPRYEALIRSKGGIDFQILGIGQNGHIGFNEPTSSLSSRTRIKTLTRETVAANRRFFTDATSQPQLAITMGIATILEAARVVLLATGEEKAEAIRASVEGPVSAMWPASVLQLHPQVTFLMDEAAASSLTLRDYYHWVAEQNRRLADVRTAPG